MILKESVINKLVAAIDQDSNFPLKKLRKLPLPNSESKGFRSSFELSILMAELGSGGQAICEKRSLDNPNQIVNISGFQKKKKISNMAAYHKTMFIDGEFHMQWRSGVKHDRSRIYCLEKKGSDYLNGDELKVNVEPEAIYPYIKTIDIQTYFTASAKHSIVVPYQSLKEKYETALEKRPLALGYLDQYSNVLERRKSSVFKTLSPFAIFGIGDYAFKPYKIAIGSTKLDPMFSLIAPINGKPAMLDNLLNYIGFDTLDEAVPIWILLNCDYIWSFLKSISFSGQMRRFPIEVLKRIDLHNLIGARSTKQLTNALPDELIKAIEANGYESSHVIHQYQLKILD